MTAAHKANVGTLVRVLREVMIRHTKDQRLGGAVALALPASDATTVWLEMTSDEKALYDIALDKSRRALRQVKQKSVHRSTLESKLAHVRGASSHIYAEDKLNHMSPEQNKAFTAVHEMIPHTEKKKGRRIWRTNPAKCTKLQALLKDLAELKKVGTPVIGRMWINS